MRLIVALSVAGALAIFLLYTAIAGSGTATIKPSQLTSKVGKVQIVGTVIGPAVGSSYAARGLRFRMRDIDGKMAVPVVYHGDVGALCSSRDRTSSSPASSTRASSSPSGTRC